MGAGRCDVDPGALTAWPISGLAVDMLRLMPLLALALGTPVAAQTVRSLDKVPGVLKTPEARAVFAEQIQGKPAPDGLGRRLPAVLTKTQVIDLLVPADQPSDAFVGARLLPGQLDTYVAIACTGGDKDCDELDAPKSGRHVYIGLIQAPAGAKPRRLAKPAALDGRVDWNDTLLGDAPEEAEEAKGGLLPPQEITRFDLAPYVIAPGQRAFGLMGKWSTGYAGGGAEFSALYLFAVVDGTLTQILATPMSFYKMLAGDWHKDGTRDHDVTEDANVLIVTKRVTNGHFDLLQKARLGGGSRVFKWSATANRYEAAP